jgi:hypothetical protein
MRRFVWSLVACGSQPRSIPQPHTADASRPHGRDNDRASKRSSRQRADIMAKN